MDDDSEDSESFENILDEVLEGLVEDTQQVYEKLTEYFRDYENPVINAALIEVSTLLYNGNVDSFLEIYSDLEKKLPATKKKNKFEEAARIRAAVNLYITSNQIMMEYEWDENPEILFEDEGGNGEKN